MASNPARLAELRERLDGIVEGRRLRASVLPFGVPEIDQRLPRRGLANGALHEIAGGAAGAVDGAVAASFVAGIAARTGGQVLWCYTRPDLFAPALAESGLTADRVVFFEAGDEKSLMGCFEEAVRHGGLSAVVAEIATLERVPSQRIQMAAESSGTMALALRRWRRQLDARDFGHPTAAMTRWRVTELPSQALSTRGVGRARWLLEMMRCRGGQPADFEVEACDAKGFVSLPSVMADRPAAAEDGWIRAAS